MTTVYHKDTVPLWVENLTAFCVIISASVGLTYFYATEHLAERQFTLSVQSRSLTPPEELPVNPYENIGLEAEAAIVYDAVNKHVIFSRNADMQLPLASITKLMTAIVATETLPPYTSIPIVDRDIEYDPKLKVGERWSLTDLITYTLITSSNTGADSAAVAVAAFLEGKGTEATPTVTEDRFVALMNAKAEELGLSQTYFLNGSGLDTLTKVSGAYGSANDMALLATYMVQNHYNLFEPTRNELLEFRAPDGRTIEARNTNSSVGKIPGILGSKTGLTDLAGGNLVLAFDASFGEPFIIVVLGSSEEGRFADAEKLVNATIAYLGAGLMSHSPAIPNE